MNCVIKQIGEHAVELVRIAQHPGGSGLRGKIYGESAPAHEHLHVVAHFLHQIAQRDGLQAKDAGSICVYASQEQHVDHQATETVVLSFHGQQNTLLLGGIIFSPHEQHVKVASEYG